MKLRYVFLIAIAFIVLIGSSYVGQYYYVRGLNHFVKYNVLEQDIFDKDWNSVRKLKQGQGFIYHVEVASYNKECFAEYALNLHNDKVDYQFPTFLTRKTGIVLSDYPQGYYLNGYFEIPKDLPVGHYHFYQNAYPKCESFDVPPFELEVNLEVDVVSK